MNYKQINRIIVCLVVVCALFMSSCGSSSISEETIAEDFYKAFGQDMLWGVHVMGDGNISIVGCVPGVQKTEQTMSDALTKTRDFISLLSARSVPKDVETISVVIGIDGREENNILFTLELDTETLKNTAWDELKTYEEFMEKANITLSGQ